VVCLPGGLRHCHRKLHAFEHPRMSSGDRFTVFDTSWGLRIGILIGADNYLVENLRMTALMGATLLIAPHRTYGMGGDGSAWTQPMSMEQALRCVAKEHVAHAKADGGAVEWLRRWLPAHAAGSGMFAVFSGGVDGAGEDSATGAGMIVDPFGRTLADTEGGATTGCLISAEIDVRSIGASAGRQWLAARRPDLYGILSRAERLCPRRGRACIRAGQAEPHRGITGVPLVKAGLVLLFRD
jgi:predicted amidohydrolase